MVSKSERTIKTVLVSVPSVKGYSRWVYRVVECNVDQHGYLSERGVKVIWQSQYLYRPVTKSGRGKGPEAKERAEELAEMAAKRILLDVGPTVGRLQPIDY